MGYKSPQTYTVAGGHAAYTPLDATAYHFGGFQALAPSTTATYHRIHIPKSGFIRQAAYYAWAITTTGTNEAWDMVIRKNDTTDYVFGTVTAATADRTWTNHNLNIPVSAGDYICIKTTTPTWATNPDGIRGVVHLVIEAE